MADINSDSIHTEQWRRLQWQCRRGIKEVEVLLVPFFETHFSTLDDADKARFILLLEQQDADLFEWFTQRCEPVDADLQSMVSQVLRSVGA